MGRRVRVMGAALVALLLLPGIALASDDPYRSQQWALDDLRIDEAWDVGRGDGAVVAVVDTGVDVDHPDLAERMLRDPGGEVIGLDLVDEGEEPADRHGHGTLVAGIVAASAGNGQGVAGVAPRARIMPIRVLDEAGAGRARDVGRAIRWAVDNGADVVNLSLESLRDDAGSSPGPGAPSAAVDYAWAHDVVVVVASGNNGATISAYPDDTPALVVGASDQGGEPTRFSDDGGTRSVLAPGVDIISTWCRDRSDDGCDGDTHTYGIAEGTSFAAPHVSGIAALLAGEGYDAEEIVHRIRASAERSGEHRAGHVDAAAALGVDGDLQAMSVEPRPGDADPDEPRERAGSRSEPAPDPEPDPEPAPAPDPDPDPPPAPQPDPDPPPDPEPESESDPPPTPDAEPAPEPAPVADPGGAPAPSAEPVALSPPDREVSYELWVQLLAAGLVGMTLAMWSAVARRDG